MRGAVALRNAGDASQTQEGEAPRARAGALGADAGARRTIAGAGSIVSDKKKAPHMAGLRPATKEEGGRR